MNLKHVRVPYAFLLLGPALLFCLGFLSNALVLAANTGHMPVQGDIECAQNAAKDAGDVIHVCMTKASRLKLLADWIYWPGEGTASPGDFLELVGQYGFYPCLFVWIGFIVKDHSDIWE
jgi:hypothetical protein